MSAETRLSELNIVLPKVATPAASYLQFRISGNLLFVSGQGPRDVSGQLVTGKIGADLSLEDGIHAARLAGLNVIAEARHALGSLDRVDTIVKMLCLVNAPADFKDQPKVANRMSDLFADIFGDSGRHARSAIGVASLPNNMAVEIEGIIAIKG